MKVSGTSEALVVDHDNRQKIKIRTNMILILCRKKNSTKSGFSTLSTEQFQLGYVIVYFNC